MSATVHTTVRSGARANKEAMMATFGIHHVRMLLRVLPTQSATYFVVTLMTCYALQFDG